MLKKRLRVIVLTVFILICLLITGVSIVWQKADYDDIQYHKPYFEDRSKNSQTYISTHSMAFQNILTTVMDSAEVCQKKHLLKCEVLNQSDIYRNLTDPSNLPDFPSTYFIRIKDNTIQKLFLSGHFEETKISTSGEKRVRDFLMTKNKQKNMFCFNLHFNSYRCLADLSSAQGTEDIIPFNLNGKNIGAVVRLYGQ